MKPARESASSRPKPCASLKKPHGSCSFAAPCWPSQEENRQWSEINFSLINPPVRALCFGLATWVQSSHPASLRPSPIPGANPVLTHKLFCSLPLSAAVRQFWCHDRLYEWSGLRIQLEVHRQRHRICRWLVTACLDSLSSPHFHGLGLPRPEDSQGRACCMEVE